MRRFHCVAVCLHVQARVAHAARVGAFFATVALLLVGDPDKGAALERCLTVTEQWRGTWEVTVDYIDHKTGTLVASDVTTATICPGIPIKPPLLDTLVSCSGDSSGRAITLSCRAKHALRHGCNVFVEVSFASDRNGDAWTGAGQWTAKVVGNCEHLELGEDVVVSGRRLSRDATCGSKEPSLVERFFLHSALIPVLGNGVTK